MPPRPRAAQHGDPRVRPVARTPAGPPGLRRLPRPGVLRLRDLVPAPLRPAESLRQRGAGPADDGHGLARPALPPVQDPVHARRLDQGLAPPAPTSPSKTPSRPGGCCAGCSRPAKNSPGPTGSSRKRIRILCRSSKRISRSQGAAKKCNRAHRFRSVPRCRFKSQSSQSSQSSQRARRHRARQGAGKEAKRCCLLTSYIFSLNLNY